MANGNTSANPFRKKLIRFLYWAFCFPKLNLIQALTKRSDSELVDKIGVREGEVFEGGMYDFNGTDNFIDTGVKVQGQTAVNFSVKCNILVSDAPSSHSLFYCGAHASGNKGLAVLLLNSGGLRVYTSDGTTQILQVIGTLSTSLIITNYSINWSGITGELITVNINGVDYSTTNNLAWSGESSEFLAIAKYSTLTSLTGQIGEFSYTINGNDEVFHYCEEGSGAISYSTTSGKTATINGTLTNFHTTNKLFYSDANARGYAINSAVPGVNIPLGSDLVPVATYTSVYRGRVKYNGQIKSSVFNFNGTDNEIDLGVKQVGGTSVSFEAVILPTNISTRAESLFFNGAYTTASKGLRLNIKLNTGELSLEVSDGVVKNTYDLGVFVNNNAVNSVYFSWSGISGAACTVIVNGISNNVVINTDWVGDSFLSTRIGRSVSTYYFTGAMAYVKLNISGLGVLFPFSNNAGSTVYDVNSDTAYNITGTITAASWSLENTGYNYNLVNGVSKDNTEYVINGTFDTDINNWSNDGTSILSWDGTLKAMLVNRNASGVSSGERTATQIISGLIIGKEYTFRCDVLALSHGASIHIYKSDLSLSLADSIIITSVGSLELSWVALTTDIAICIGARSSTAATVKVDNITFQSEVYYPASKLNIGDDVLGNTLDYVSDVRGVIPCESNYYNYLTYDLLNADKFGKWFNYGFTNNGTDNYIDLGAKQTGGTSIYFEKHFKTGASLSTHTLFSNGGYSGGAKGLFITIISTKFEVWVNNGTAIIKFQTGLTALINTEYLVKFSWSGTSGETATLNINGVDYTTNIFNSWVGDSHTNNVLGAYSGGLAGFNPFTNYYTKLIINGVEQLFPFYQGQGTQVEDINTGTKYDIEGTTFDWVDRTQKELSFDDIEQNYGAFNYAFCNVLDEITKIQILLYSKPQDLTTRINIAECFLKQSTLPSGEEWLTDDNGEYLTTDNGQYLHT